MPTNHVEESIDESWKIDREEKVSYWPMSDIVPNWVRDTFRQRMIEKCTHDERYLCIFLLLSFDSSPSGLMIVDKVRTK